MVFRQFSSLVQSALNMVDKLFCRSSDICKEKNESVRNSENYQQRFLVSAKAEGYKLDNINLDLIFFLLTVTKQDIY